MQIELKDLSKRYQFEWIFRHLDYTFLPNSSYAILGHNGSGKSTLLQLLSGYLSPSKGDIEFILQGRTLDIGEVYRSISYAAPYIEVVEEFTLKEAIHFHQAFQPFIKGVDVPLFIERLELPKSALHKPIQFFSSGMKQRLKLALAFFSDTPVLLLDEPTITLDKEGVKWYRQLLEELALNKRLVVVASNIEADFAGCQEQLSILDYKGK